MGDTYESTGGLAFSLKANWVPLYVNGKLIAGRAVPLHRLEEKIYHAMDTRGCEELRPYFYSSIGFHCEPEDRRLTAADFLLKNRMVGHAYLISYGKTVLVLGYNLFHHCVTKSNPRKGVHIDYFSSLQLNYPQGIRLPYLGNYVHEDTFYRVRGIGIATVALACALAVKIHPRADPSDVAVDLTARSDEILINKRYLECYHFERYHGKRGKHNELYLTHKNAKRFIQDYENSYRALERPEGNGLTYRDPYKY